MSGQTLVGADDALLGLGGGTGACNKNKQRKLVLESTSYFESFSYISSRYITHGMHAITYETYNFPIIRNPSVIAKGCFGGKTRVHVGGPPVVMVDEELLTRTMLVRVLVTVASRIVKFKGTFELRSFLVSHPEGRSCVVSENMLTSATRSLLCWYLSKFAGSLRIRPIMCLRVAFLLYIDKAS